MNRFTIALSRPITIIAAALALHAVAPRATAQTCPNIIDTRIIAQDQVIFPNPPIMRSLGVMYLSSDGRRISGSASSINFPTVSISTYEWTPSTGQRSLGFFQNGGHSFPAASADATALARFTDWTAQEGSGSSVFRLPTITGAPGVGLGGMRTFFTAMSGNGLAMIGSGNVSGLTGTILPFRWSAAAGAHQFGTLDGQTVTPQVISFDGSAVAGVYTVAGVGRAWRWTEATGLQEFGGAGFSNIFPRRISDDGRTIIGTCSNDADAIVFRWTQDGGMENRGVVSGAGTIAAMTEDGSAIASTSNSQAYHWTPESGLVRISPANATLAEATAMSADGRVVAGWYRTGNSSNPKQVFRWTFAGGLRTLANGDPPRMSADGRIVAWILREPGVSRVFLWHSADLDDDGQLTPDDFADFITCFFLDIQVPGTCIDADFNFDGFRNSDDLADYITTFFLGCG